MVRSELGYEEKRVSQNQKNSAGGIDCGAFSFVNSIDAV
jgi:hypothetical protein